MSRQNALSRQMFDFVYSLINNSINTNKHILYNKRASLMVQLVKNPPVTRETWVPSVGWEDPLEKGKTTHSGILAWRIPWTV